MEFKQLFGEYAPVASDTTFLDPPMRPTLEITQSVTWPDTGQGHLAHNTGCMACGINETMTRRRPHVKWSSIQSTSRKLYWIRDAWYYLSGVEKISSDLPSQRCITCCPYELFTRFKISFILFITRLMPKRPHIFLSPLTVS